MGWGGRLFEDGRLLTFSAFGMGAYSRWALVRDWALIRINTVLCKQPTKSVRHILRPVNFSARGLRRLRATRLIHEFNDSFESILGRLRFL